MSELPGYTFSLSYKYLPPFAIMFHRISDYSRAYKEYPDPV